MASALDDWSVPDTGWGVSDENFRLKQLQVKIPDLQEKNNSYFFLNKGNTNSISYYVDRMIDTRYGKLLVAPCGIGKSKFAPGLIAKTMKKRNIVMLSERIKSTQSTFDWYKKHPLKEVNYYEMRAGGVTKSFGKKGDVSMIIMTTNAWADKKMTTSDDTVVILDEAHNLTSGTIKVMRSVPKDRLVRMTATPIDDGYALDLSTPFASKVFFESWSSLDLVEHVQLNPHRSHLVILPTIFAVDEMLESLKKRLTLNFITATGFGIKCGKRLLTFEEMSNLVDQQPTVVIATDVLQESVTLNIQSVWDQGQRCRPITDIAKRLREKIEDADWSPDELIVPITWPEVGQVCGRVGRLQSTDIGEAHISISFGLPRNKQTYVPENRDGILTNGKWVPSKKLMQLSVFKRFVDRECASGKSSGAMRRLQRHLEHIEVPKSLCDNFYEKQEIVKKMFETQEVQEDESSEDDDVEIVADVNLTEPFVESCLKKEETVLFTKENLKGSSGTFYEFEKDAKSQKPNVEKLLKRTNFMFGEIKGDEAVKLKNRSRRRYHSLAEANKQGFCSLKMYSAKERRCLKGWKPNMRLSQLYEIAPFKSGVRLHLTGPSFCHVVESGQDWQLNEQVQYFASKGFNPMVGADDDDYIDMIERLNSGDDTEFHAAVAHLIEIEDDKLYIDDDVYDDIAELGGDKDCWSKIFTKPQVVRSFNSTRVANAAQAREARLAEIEGASPITLDQFVKFANDHTRLIGAPRIHFKNIAKIKSTLEELHDSYWVRFVVHSINRLHIEDAVRSDVPLDGYIQLKQILSECEAGIFLDRFRRVRDSGCFDEDEVVEIGDKTGALTGAIRGIVSPVTQEGIDAAMQGPILDEIGRMNQLCPFKIHSENVEYFNTLGIPHYTESPRTHSHPVHYAIRMNKLINVIPSYLDADTTVVNMKKSNLEKLRKQVKVNIESRVVLRSAKDLGRFGKDVCDSPFTLKPIKTPILVLDQMAHYCSAADIIELFQQSEALQVVVAGHEFPIPALFSSASPLPTLWQHRIENGVLKYKCEMDEAEMYEQPFDPSLLMAKSLRNADSSVVLYCQVVHSHLNSHTQIISRIPITTDAYLPVQMHDFIELMPVHRNRYLCDLVPRTLYDKLMDYAQSMGELKPTEMRAKLRLHLDPAKFWMDENTKEELITVVSTIVSKADEARKSTTKYYGTVGQKVTYNTLGRVHNWVASKFSRKFVRRWRALAAAEHPLKLIPLVTLTSDKFSKGSIVNFQWQVDDDHKLSFFETFKMLFKRYMDYEQFKFLEADRDWVSDPKILGNKMKFLTVNQRNVSKYTDKEFEEHWSDRLREMYKVKKVGHKPVDPPIVHLGPKKIARVPKVPKKAWEDSEDKFVKHAKKNANEKSLHVPMSVAVDLVKTKDRAVRRYQRNFEDPIQYYDPMFTWVAHEPKEPLEPHDIALPLDIGDEYEGIVYEDEGIWYYESPCPTSDDDVETSDDTVSVLSDDVVQVSDTPSAVEEEYVKMADMVEEGDLEAVEEAERVVEFSFPIPGKVEEVILEKVNDTYQERVERSEVVAANAKLSYEPRITALPPTVWWNEKYPLSVDQRFNEVPFWPVEVHKMPYPKQDCLLVSFSSLLNALGIKISESALWVLLCQHLPKDIPKTYEEYGLSTQCLDFLCIHFMVQVRLDTDEGYMHYGVRSSPPYDIVLRNFHFEKYSGRIPLCITAETSEEGFVPKVARDLVQQLRNNPMIEFKPFIPDTEAPDRYLFHLIAKRVGTFKDNPVNEERLKAWDVQLKAAIRLEKSKPKERYMAVVVGDPGCGKSMGVVNILKQAKFHVPGVFQVCLPLATVRDDWSKKLEVRRKKGVSGRPTNSAMVCTFEYALAKTHGGHVLVLDEDKYPTGFIALMCYLKPSIKYVIFLGDPFQGKWHDPGGKADELNAMPGELERYLSYASWYIIGTNRFGKEMGNIMCTPVRFEAQYNGIRFIQKIPTSAEDLRDIYPNVPISQLKAWWNDHAFLEASNAAAEASNMLNNNDTITMSSSQGLTKSLVIIHMNITVVRLVGMDILWVALSRSQRVLIYVSLINAGVNAGLINSKPGIKTLMDYSHGAIQGRSVKANPTKVVDFRRLQGGLNPNWKIVLAFPPDECSNWESVKQFFPKIFGFLEQGKFVRYGGSYYRDIDHNDEGHQGNPYIATRRLGYKVRVNEEVFVPQPTYPLPDLKTKLIRGHLEAFKESVNETLRVEKDREIFDEKLGYSGQVPEGYKMRLDYVSVLNKKVEENQQKYSHMTPGALKRHLRSYYNSQPDSDNPLKYSTQILNWGLSQRNSDEVSYLRMMVERVRKGSAEMNQIEFKLQAPYGDAMWKAWTDYTGWKHKVPLDEIAYEAALAKFVARRAARSVAAKKQGLSRADPDFPRYIVGKTQMKLKSLEIKNASALQTTLTMDDEYLFTLGGVGVYLLDKILESCPSYLYLHAKKTFSETSEFVSKYFNTDEYWESDLEQQEQSMRGGALQFMLRLMEHFGIPSDKIDYFKSMKLNTQVGRFVLALQTASGEIFTWLMNTLANGGRIALKYSLKKGDGLMLTGDDSLCNRFMRISNQWAVWKHLDFAREKSVESSEEAGFASYLVKKGFIYRNPEILLRRLMVYNEMGKIKDVIAGYFLEWLTIYRLSDHLFNLLSERQMECHNILSNFIFNSRRRLKVNASFGWNKKVGIDIDTHNEIPREIMTESPEILELLSDPWDDESNMYVEDEL